MDNYVRRMSWRRLSVAVIVVLALTRATSSFAQTDAEKQKALDLFKKGQAQSNLGNFDKAIEYFEEGYTVVDHAIFLFNIGQAYRQSGNCERALFFYKRYLSVARTREDRKPDIEKEVQDRIPELAECVANAAKPPDGPQPLPPVVPRPDPPVTTAPDPAPKSVVDVQQSGGDTVTTTTAKSEDSAPHAFTPSAVLSSVEAGVGIMNLPRLDGSLLSVRAGFGYPIVLGPLAIDVGALIGLTPVPWTHMGNTGTSLLSSILGNVGGNYSITESLTVRGEIGVGLQNFSGLIEGNAFTHDGAAATAPLTMLNMRFGLGVSFALTDNLLLSASPFVYSTSEPHEGLAAEITDMNRIEILAGLGYRR